MTEIEEGIVYDAMAAMREQSEILRALAVADGSDAAKRAFRFGIYAPCVALQTALGTTAMARGAARQQKNKREVEDFLANQPVK